MTVWLPKRNWSHRTNSWKSPLLAANADLKDADLVDLVNSADGRAVPKVVVPKVVVPKVVVPKVVVPKVVVPKVAVPKVAGPKVAGLAFQVNSEDVAHRGGDRKALDHEGRANFAVDLKAVDLAVRVNSAGAALRALVPKAEVPDPAAKCVAVVPARVVRRKAVADPAAQAVSDEEGLVEGLAVRMGRDRAAPVSLAGVVPEDLVAQKLDQRVNRVARKGNTNAGRTEVVFAGVVARVGHKVAQAAVPVAADRAAGRVSSSVGGRQLTPKP